MVRGIGALVCKLFSFPCQASGSQTHLSLCHSFIFFFHRRNSYQTALRTPSAAPLPPSVFPALLLIWQINPFLDSPKCLSSSHGCSERVSRVSRDQGLSQMFVVLQWHWMIPIFTGSAKIPDLDCAAEG